MGLEIIDGICCDGVAWVRDGIVITAVICGADEVDCAKTPNERKVKRSRHTESLGIIVKPYQMLKPVDNLLR